jgi:CO/xanthine dehydrogenase Mo-binding subunit
MTGVETIGRTGARVDGPAKVTGRAQYAADVNLPGQLWAGILRSPHPHASIVRIDATRARAMPGVHVVLTGADVGTIRYGRRLMDVPVLVADRARFVGDKVAAVAAESPALVDAALATIEVEYAELAPIFDPLEAMRPDCPPIHPDYRAYQGLPASIPDLPNVLAVETVARGDVDAALAAADVVVETTMAFPAVHHAYIEPHACLVSPQADGSFRIWASNKNPFLLREQLAAAFALPADQLIIEPTFTGGDFGGKGSPMEVPVCLALARAAGRPVKLVMSYLEELQAANPRHPTIATLRTGATHDGRLLAHDARFVFNSGAYGGYKPLPTLNLAASHHAAGVYRIPAARVESTMVYTNQVPGGHQRAPGEVQATVAMEIQMDRLAERLGIDPLELRVRNAVEDGDVGPLGEPWQDITLRQCIEQAREASGWGGPKAPRTGRGIAVCQRAAAGGQSNAEVRLAPDGMIEVITGTNESGAGGLTVLAEIVARRLGVPIEQVRVHVEGTDVGGFDQGPSGSRFTFVGGNAALAAAEELVRALTPLAAEVLGGAADSVVLEGGQFVDRTRPGSTVSFRDLAARSPAGDRSGRGAFSGKAPNRTSFAAQVAEVEVDGDTGQVDVRRIVGVHDVGEIISRQGLVGQIDGGIAWGLGYALMEELRIEDGRVTTTHFGDYRIPSIADMPPFESILLTDSRGDGPFGAKAVAELSLLPTAAAIVNAIHDATGAWILDLPVTAEKVLAALEGPGDRTAG